MDRSESLRELIRRGERFTYENFSTKSERGYPEAPAPDWVAWRARVSGAISSLFGVGSGPNAMLQRGLAVNVIGDGEDKFELSKSYFIGALRAALEVLEHDTFGELADSAHGPGTKSRRVFVVHGHDHAAKNQLEGLLTEMGLEPVVLHRKPDHGLTVIEKFEKYSDVGFAFVILTPDEIAYLAAEETLPDEHRDKERRARPNVIFEFGFFVGRLGRENVCCLHRGETRLPSDLSGLLYKAFQEDVEEVAWDISKELRARGYELVQPT